MRKRRNDDEVILPEAGDQLPVVSLSTRHGSNHPWIFRRMIGDAPPDLAPGQLVEVLDKFGQFVGRGFYNDNSEIAVRLVTLDPKSYPDRRWFLGAVTRAVRLRHDILKLPNVCNAYRLIHSEGDGISGLVADKYANTIVLQLFSAGAHRHLPWIEQGFREHFPDHEIIVKSDHRTEKLEGVKMDGAPPSTRGVVIEEHGLKLNVDLRRGHKTGYFLDQRDNRRRVRELAAGKTVFDGFCYTAGFGLSAALGGAEKVESCDLDEKAIEIAETNKTLNGIGEKHQLIHGDIFSILRDRRTAKTKYDLMVLDPAKLAMGKSEVSKALSAYADMNRLGLQCMAFGGVLVSCSCTGSVSEEEFLMALRAAASEANVELQVFAIHGPGEDHPWALRVPEGRYLKAVYSRVLPLK